MIYTKYRPVGIDVWIQDMQQDLYDYLQDVWQLTADEYNCYGRVYRNRKDSGYVPEVFTNNNDYKELLLDDSVTVHSFFGIGSNITIDNYKSQTADVHLVFFINLAKIKPQMARADVEARRDVLEMLKYEMHQFIMKSEVTGVERVLQEYPGLSKTDMVKFDTHPWHCFRYNMQCTYDPFLRSRF